MKKHIKLFEDFNAAGGAEEVEALRAKMEEVNKRWFSESESLDFLYDAIKLLRKGDVVVDHELLDVILGVASASLEKAFREHEVPMRLGWMQAESRINAFYEAHEEIKRLVSERKKK